MFELGEIELRHGVSRQLGELVASHGSDVLVVTDQHVAGRTPHLGRVLDELCVAGVGSEVHVIPVGQCGYVSSAIAVSDRMRTNAPSPVCVALGGGAVLDAVKLAVAAVGEPWLLDRALWSNSLGVLANLAPESRAVRPRLVALPTLPGSGAHVSDRVCLAPRAGYTRRLVQSPMLLPTAAVVDPVFSYTLDRQTLMESICEVLYRVVAPYLVTQQSTRRQDQVAAGHIASLVQLGESLRLAEDLSLEQRIELDRLSIETVLGRYLESWAPVSHPWWCIQNSVITQVPRSKGSLTAQALPHVLSRVKDGDERLGLYGRWRTLERRVEECGMQLEFSLSSFLAAVISRDSHGLHSDYTLESWAQDAYVLWAQLIPGIRCLGVDGIREFLLEAGF